MPVLSAAEGPPEAGRGSPAHWFPDRKYLVLGAKHNRGMPLLSVATCI